MTIQNGHTITVTAAAAAHDLYIHDGGTLTLSGSDLSIMEDWYLYAGGAFNASGNRIIFNGNYNQNIIGASTFDKLTIQTTGGWYTVFNDDVTANLELALDSNAYAAGVLTLGPNAVTVGAGVLDGRVKREHTFTIGQTYDFGNVNNLITFTSGTPPSSIELRSTSGTAPLYFPNALYHQYEITPTGGGSFQATLRLAYQDGQENGVDEAQAELYRYNGSSWDNMGQSSRDATNNWVEQTDLTQFSLWAISDAAPPPTCYATAAGDWNDPAVWQNCNGGVPNSSRDAQINSQVTVTTLAAARNVNINSDTTLQGDLHLYGDFSTSWWGWMSASAGTVTLKGTTSQTISGGTFYNVTMDNVAGVTFSGTVQNVLTLTNGAFHVSSLTLSNPIAGTPTLMQTEPYAYIVISGTASGVNLPSSVSEIYILNLDNPNGTTLQAPLTVGYELDLNQGALNNTAHPLTVASGTYITRFAGSLTAAPTFDGTVTVRYFNTVPITAGPELPTASGVLSNLDTYGEKVTLNSDVSVSGFLNLYADIDAGSFIVTLEPTAFAGGTADVIGIVRRPGPFNLNNTYSFGSYYNSLTFTDGTPPDSIDITLTKSAPGTFPTAVKRTYLITPTGGSGYKATVRLRYDDADLNGNDADTLKLFRYDTTPPAHWVNMGGASEINSNYVEQTDIEQFSPWTMGSNAPTAATLTIFTARANKKARVRVKWETGSELAVVGFNVWRKKGNGEFIRLNAELIPAQNVGGIGGARYKFNAGKNKSDKTISFKLEIVKADGKSEWSEVVKVKGK